MNITLLRKVIARIKQEPFQFEMSSYITRTLFSKDASKIKIPNCNTAACIGGWAVCLHNEKKPSDYKESSVASVAREVLELTSEQSQNLFHTGHWPEEFKHTNGKHFRELTKKQQAKVAVKRINHFIATDGKE